DLCRRFSIDLGDLVGSFCDAVPVEVVQDFNRRVFCQDLLHCFSCICVCITPVQLTVDSIIDTHIMGRVDSFVIQVLCQVLSHAHYTGGCIAGCGISKFFLGVGVVDQHFRTVCSGIDLHTAAEQIICI